MSNFPKFAPEGSLDPNDTKEYCSKSLFEQLQEQKNLKQKKFEEESSFKNSVKMYDEDDLAFVNEVRQSKILKEQQAASELKSLLELAKRKEAEQLQNAPSSYDNLAEQLDKLRQSSEDSEKISKLKAILKRRREEDAGRPSKAARVEGDQVDAGVAGEQGDAAAAAVVVADDDMAVATGDDGGQGGLPGMDAYTSDVSDSDSSDSSSDSDVDVGTLRPLIKRLNDKIKKTC